MSGFVVAFDFSFFSTLFVDGVVVELLADLVYFRLFCLGVDGSLFFLLLLSSSPSSLSSNSLLAAADLLLDRGSKFNDT